MEWVEDSLLLTSIHFYYCAFKFYENNVTSVCVVNAGEMPPSRIPKNTIEEHYWKHHWKSQKGGRFYVMPRDRINLSKSIAIRP